MLRQPAGRQLETNPETRHAYEGVTPPKYAAMLKAFIELPDPTIRSIAERSGAGKKMVNRALTEGWPKLGLPPLGEAGLALTNPVEVHKRMTGMYDAKREIVENLFGDLPSQIQEAELLPPEVVDEANARAAESGMAARVSMSTATYTARAVEAIARIFLEKIRNGDIEVPDKIRPEHVFLLTKMADASANTVHKALQTERLRLGQPETIAGTQIAQIIVNATPAELEHIARTGSLPPRIMGVPPPQSPRDLPAEDE
jgi:hypothetical protein